MDSNRNRSDSTEASTLALQALVLPWLHPISEETPAGTSAKYEPAYETVVFEVSKLESITGGEVNWPKVVKLAGEVLQDVSKDVIMACNLAYGLGQTEGLAGSAKGLALVSGLMQTYWDTMFPSVERLRGRVGALSWLVERLGADLEVLEPTESDREAVSQLDQAAGHLDSLIKTCLEGEGPSLRLLRRNIDRLVMTLAAAEGAAKQEPSAAFPAVSASELAPSQSTAAVAQATGDEQGIVQEQVTQQDTDKTVALGMGKAVDAKDASPNELDLRELVQEFLAPISEQEPSGVAAKYEPAYEWITTEIAKLDALSGGVVNWSQLGGHAETILTTMSKDLVIAAYAVISWYESEGLAGLVRGLALVAELMDTFWDSMFPPVHRIRARMGSLEWLVNRLETTLADVVPAGSDRVHVEALEQLAKRLESVIRDRFEGEGPSLRGLVRTLERMQMSLPKPSEEVPRSEPQPAAAQVQGSDSQQVTPAGGAPKGSSQSRVQAPPHAAVQSPQAPVAPVSSEALGDTPRAFEEGQDVTKYLAQVGNTLTTTARLLRQADSTNPTPYRLARLGAWLHLSSEPAADAQGKTKIPPPQAALPGRLETMAANGKWQALLEETESALTQYRFWLDLHRFAAQALLSQGTAYAGAQAAVLAQLANFLARVPGVLEMSFADGTPFADPITKDWIASEVMPGDASRRSTHVDDASADLRSEATALVKASKLADALSLLAEEAEKAANHQQRFRLRLFMAKLASSAGQPTVARGIYESLYAEVEKRKLEEWDPPLAIECLHGYLMVARKLAKSDAKTDLSSNIEMSNVLFNKLCALAPSMAMALDS